MGNIIDLASRRAARRPAARRDTRPERAIACALIREAAALVGGLGEAEARLRWVLEDCADLLGNESSPGGGRDLAES